MDILTQLQTLAVLQDEHDALLKAQDEAIPQRLRTELARIAKRFAPDLDRVTSELELLELQVKAAVLMHGASVKGQRLQAVYVAGRPQWDHRMLVGYATVHHEVLSFCKLGKPSVTLRTVTEKVEAA